jgi:tetratricopeptide (TPR) repeat protein
MNNERHNVKSGSSLETTAGAATGNGVNGASKDQGKTDPAPKPMWTPAMGMLIVGISAFFTGLFVGSELLHQPKVTDAPVAVASAGAAGGSPDGASSSAAAGSGAMAGHDDASMKKMINSESDADRLTSIGQVLADQSRPDLALLAFQRVLTLGHRTSNAYLDVVKAEWDLKKFDEAEQNLHVAIQLDPKSPAAHATLGFVLAHGMNQPAAARKEFQTALALNPPDEVKTKIQAELAKLGSS